MCAQVWECTHGCGSARRLRESQGGAPRCSRWKHKGSTDHANGPAAEAVIRSIEWGSAGLWPRPQAVQALLLLSSSLHLAQALVPGSAPCPSSQESRYPSINLIPWISPASPHPTQPPTCWDSLCWNPQIIGSRNSWKNSCLP